MSSSVANDACSPPGVDWTTYQPVGTIDLWIAESHPAGVTKGAFFHHFKSKDTLAVAAARLSRPRASINCIVISSCRSNLHCAKDKETS